MVREQRQSPCGVLRHTAGPPRGIRGWPRAGYCAAQPPANRRPPRRCASNGSRLAERHSAPPGLHEGSGETRLPGGVRGWPRADFCATQPPANRRLPPRCASNGSRLAEWYSTPPGLHEGSGETRLPGGVRGWPRLRPSSSSMRRGRKPNWWAMRASAN